MHRYVQMNERFGLAKLLPVRIFLLGAAQTAPVTV
jgi:hypothetical protein